MKNKKANLTQDRYDHSKFDVECTTMPQYVTNEVTFAVRSGTKYKHLTRIEQIEEYVIHLALS